MNNKRALGITFAILGIICVITATVHAVKEPIQDSITLLLAYTALGALFFLTCKALLRSEQGGDTLRSYR